mmetsp:Transcript_35910/g.117324  ORF Transcript_35910/g.117324 Transcript_35910/m.117324 type:complete len:203 (+) Transcript_35910:532-1140(+)
MSSARPNCLAESRRISGNSGNLSNADEGRQRARRAGVGHGAGHRVLSGAVHAPRVRRADQASRHHHRRLRTDREAEGGRQQREQQHRQHGRRGRGAARRTRLVLVPSDELRHRVALQPQRGQPDEQAAHGAGGRYKQRCVRQRQCGRQPAPDESHRETKAACVQGAHAGGAGAERGGVQQRRGLLCAYRSGPSRHRSGVSST